MAVTAQPLVSVVVPVYNQGQFLAEAITSALGQSLQPVEVIVVDDGSTDCSPSVAAQFLERIVYLRQPNRGLSAARNRGLMTARADLVQLLDSDDALQPGALEKAWSAAEGQPEVSVFRAGWEEVDREGHTITRASTAPLPSDAFHALFDPMAVGPPCRSLVRRSAFATAGWFDTKLRACEDWDMWLRMAAAGLRFADLSHCHARYRNYPTSTSKDYGVMWQSGTTVLARAAARHQGCPRCGEALKDAMAAWRRWCYLSMLVPQVSRLRHQGHYAQAVQKSARAIAGDPWLAPVFARSAGCRGARASLDLVRRVVGKGPA
jgi:glycosyltransferase involved in cell wall biosynthesis